MRIIAGTWAGVSLVSPGGRVRPTTEELRNLLMEWIAEEIDGARVLDLFAGSGALGLEALSRGAASVDFVENGPPALHALKANVAKLRVGEKTRLFKRDAFVFVRGIDGTAYDLAFADPPYSSGLGARLVTEWLARPFSRLLSVEHDSAQTMPRGGTRRILGDTAITVYRGRGKPGGERRRSDHPLPPGSGPRAR